MYGLDEKQINYFKEIVKGHTTQEIIELFYNKYKIKLDIKKVRALKRKYHLISGVNTKFKKNQIPHNIKPIGYEFISTDGRTYVKVGEPNEWKHKHRLIYEQHYGEIPKGYSVVFLDGNMQNFDINNLKLIKNKEKLVMKNLHLFTKSKELTETGILVAQNIIKLSDLKKELDRK